MDTIDTGQRLFISDEQSMRNLCWTRSCRPARISPCRVAWHHRGRHPSWLRDPRAPQLATSVLRHCPASCGQVEGTRGGRVRPLVEVFGPWSKFGRSRQLWVLQEGSCSKQLCAKQLTVTGGKDYGNTWGPWKKTTFRITSCLDS